MYVNGKKYAPFRWLILLLIALLSPLKGYAVKYKERVPPYNMIYDEKLFHFGFVLGGNTMNFGLKMKEEFGQAGDTIMGIRQKMNPGFTVGVLINMRLGRYFDLRTIPALSLGGRDLEYSMVGKKQALVTENKKIETIIVEIPLELKWKAKRINNTRPYVIGGFKYTLDMASLKKKEDGNIDDFEVKLKKHDYGVVVGAGWEFYLPYSNKIGLELKAFFGFNDLIVRENNIYTDKIDRLTSRIINISVTFE